MQRLVDRGEEHCVGFSLVGNERGDTDAQVRLPDAAGEAELGEAFPHPLGDAYRALDRRAGQQDRELVTAMAGGKIGCALDTRRLARPIMCSNLSPAWCPWRSL
jgi:hypothetical protein